MSRVKLSVLLGLTLLLALPVGLAQAQEEETAPPSGTAVIWDDAALSDAITYTMSNVPAPDAGTVLEGWLVSDDGSVKLSTDVMTVEEDGSINHTYVSPTGDNLIHSYDKVVVTVEPVSDNDPGPSGIFAYSASVPSGGMAHIRHLLTNWPPGADKGILTNLKEQLGVALLHAQLADNQNTIAGIQQHLEHVINAIEGPTGANYGDLDGNGSTEDFGDGIGVLAHAADRAYGPFAAGAAAESARIVAGAALVDEYGKNAEDWAGEARDNALFGLDQTNVNFAKINVANTISLLDAALNGFDSDGDGDVDVPATAGAYVAAQEMAAYDLEPGALPGPAGPSLGGLSVGDSSVKTAVQAALIASLVLLGAGGILLASRRRIRTTR